MRKVLSYFLSVLLTMQGHVYGQTSGEEIIGQFRAMQAEYALPDYRSHEDIKNIIVGMDIQLYQLSHGIEKNLAKSYNYIKENYHNPEVYRSSDYARVVNMANKLHRFHQMKVQLVDDGCLTSDSEKVRKLTLGVLQSSMLALRPDECIQKFPVLKDQAYEFIVNIDQAIDCISHPEKRGDCQLSPTPRAKGIWGHRPEKRLRIIQGVLQHKRKLDKSSLDLLDYAFTQHCNGEPELCAQVELKFPNGHLEESLSAVNREIMLLNTVSKEVRSELKKKRTSRPMRRRNPRAYRSLDRSTVEVPESKTLMPRLNPLLRP